MRQTFKHYKIVVDKSFDKKKKSKHDKNVVLPNINKSNQKGKYNYLIFKFIENNKNVGTQQIRRLYKTGSFSEWYNTKLMKEAGKSMEEKKNKKFLKNDAIENKLIKIKIIFGKQYEALKQMINTEISKNNENEETEIEIYNNETIENLIEKYCNSKKVKKDNLLLMNKDLKYLKKNITIRDAKINNNETVFIFEDNQNKDI